MNKVFFYNADVPFVLKNKQFLKSGIEDLFKREKQGLQRINYIFCSDDYLLRINQNYLKHNTLTDVISFYLSEETAPVFGEVYISTQRIKYNAITFNVPYYEEIVRVVIHGALHLCGYADKNKHEIIIMRSKEKFYLKKFKFHVKAQ